MFLYISRGGDVPWHAHSPDLSACGYVLWGYLISDLFISKPSTIEELTQRIKEKILAIPEQMTRRVTENLRECLERCLCTGGRLLNAEIFKYILACTDLFSDNSCYLIRWNVIVLFRFENSQIFLPHPVP
jgi:hypothetical protein